MKTERHRRSALIGASVQARKITKKCKDPDRSELLTKGLKVGIDCTVSSFRSVVYGLAWAVLIIEPRQVV